MKLSQKYREFELFNYNLSIQPDYDDRDVVNIKAGKHHTNKKINISGRDKMKKRL